METCQLHSGPDWRCSIKLPPNLGIEIMEPLLHLRAGRTPDVCVCMLVVNDGVGLGWGSSVPLYYHLFFLSVVATFPAFLLKGHSPFYGVAGHP